MTCLLPCTLKNQLGHWVRYDPNSFEMFCLLRANAYASYKHSRLWATGLHCNLGCSAASNLSHCSADQAAASMSHGIKKKKTEDPQRGHRKEKRPWGGGLHLLTLLKRQKGLRDCLDQLKRVRTRSTDTLSRFLRSDKSAFVFEPKPPWLSKQCNPLTWPRNLTFFRTLHRISPPSILLPFHPFILSWHSAKLQWESICWSNLQKVSLHLGQCSFCSCWIKIYVWKTLQTGSKTDVKLNLFSILKNYT